VNIVKLKIKLTQQIDEVTSNRFSASHIGKLHELNVSLSVLALFDAAKPNELNVLKHVLTGTRPCP
jgi:hypothetical protein